METKWIDLGDPTARLKLGQHAGGLYLFIVGLSNIAPQWARAVSELGFVPAQNNRYLVRRIRDGESPRASTFRAIWPRAGIAMMDRDAFFIDFAKNRRDANRSQEDRQTEIDLTHYERLGRNANGDEVLNGSLGRVVRTIDDSVVLESDQVLRSPMFLRAENEQDLATCANGFVHSMDKGEVQYRGDMERFISAVFADATAPTDLSKVANVRAHIHAAMLRQVRAGHDTAQDAYGDAARLYEYLPPFWGVAPGAGALPLPLAVIAQRLLGDTSEKTVLVPNAYDGATCTFLPEATRVHAFRGANAARDLPSLAPVRDGVTWHETSVEMERLQADAIFFNADPVLTQSGQRADYTGAMRALRALVPNGRAVLALAGDDPRAPGVTSAASEQFLRALADNYEIEDAFELGAEMTQKLGTGAALRIISLRNAPPAANARLQADSRFPSALPVVHGWDGVKSRVDETLARAAIREAESDDVDLKRIAEENVVQRPYLPFSKIGEARTMVPSNLQEPLSAALSDVEARFGPIDDFVSSELGFFRNTLGERLSPEQVDAVGPSMARILAGRANILGDETGIGKGRTLGSLAVWANKLGKSVVFITDRANLFSDFFGGDLGDLGERGRFRPMILNSGEPIVDKNSPLDPPPILISASKPADIERIIDQNSSLADLGVNLVFATYSQLNGAESEKATWLKNQLSTALLIVDESHVAAGSDSNISTQIESMAQLAWGVQYSSATWAKSSKNLGIYSRAFPETINTTSLAETMKRGGEAFSEIFSAMLARDGALMRREHDLSRMERVIQVDEEGRDRNIQVSDAIAAVMNQIAIVSGDVDRMMIRLNGDVMRDLRAAHDVRASGLKVNVFSASFGAGSVLYQINRRVLAALNAPHVARLCAKSLDDGMRPIVIFDDTGEALTNQLLDDAAQENAEGVLVRPDTLAEPTIKDLMRRVLLRLSRVRVTPKNAAELLAADDRYRDRDTAGDDDGDVPVDAAAIEAQLVPVQPDHDDRADIEGAIAAMQDAAAGPGRTRSAKVGVRYIEVDDLPDLSEDQRAIYKRGLERISSLIDALPDVPLNAPDVVHNLLREQGYRTGEISGRSFQLTKTGEGDLCRVVPRSKKKSFVTATVRAYQNGEIDVIVINRAAATGIGLHAQPRFADPRKRNAIWLQSPENPTEVSQLAGRSNRYDQLSAPRMTFACTGLYGEVRQIMMNNRKQVMMACNVRSSRDAAIKHESVPDLLNEVGREAVRQTLIDNPGYCQRMGVPSELIEDETSDATRWLNRIPMLAHSDQEKIYSEIYASFDEAILRHELAGTNPLKAKELDIGAELVGRSVFIGVETGGVGSAFDGPVYLQSIKWKERLTPMSWSAVEDLVRKGRDGLISSGRAVSVGAHQSGMPLLDLTALRERVAKQMDALARIALSATSYESVTQALLHARPSHPVRRAHARMHWIEEHLEQLQPGFTISVQDERNVMLQRQAVITGVDVPPSGREHQFGRWKIHTVAAGESRPVTYTLSSIINRSTPEDADRGVQTVFGRDLYGERHADDSRRVLQERFDLSPSGLRERVANVLTGNMYLASEWASATKLGSGVIFTDDRKVRHRGVMLHPEFEAERAQFLPIRVWDKRMVQAYVSRALYGDFSAECGGHTHVDRNFRSAWANAQGDANGRKDGIIFQRDVGITLGVSGDGAVRKMAASLRKAQEKLRCGANGEKISADEDALNVTIKAKAKKAIITLAAPTPEHMARAVEILATGGGLEIYVPRRGAQGELASKVIEDYFEARRQQAVELLETHSTARRGREAGIPAHEADGTPQERMAA